MTKREAMAIQKKYGMEIIRNPITDQAWAIYLESPAPIQELDDLATQDLLSCAMVADYSAQEIKTTYKLACPAAWFNLWG